jgi:hypothetical protein
MGVAVFILVLMGVVLDECEPGLCRVGFFWVLAEHGPVGCA